MVAVVLAGTVTVAATEGLGAVGALGTGGVLAAWGAAAAAALALHRRGPRRRRAPGPPAAGRVPALERALLAWTLVVAALTLLTALRAAPATWDSLTYHLPRVAHWAQNGSVAFYPTHVIRQLHSPPFAEYAMLQLYLLTGGDRWLNLVQWGAFAGCLLGTGVIARELGAGVRGQAAAVFVCATIPMGILQASSTQNDYVTALWLVCLVHALLVLRRRPSLGWTLAAGAALGLFLLTKGTAYVLAGPVVGLLLWPGPAFPARAGLRAGLLVVLCAVAVNGAQYARNADVFGSVLGPGGEGGSYRYRNEELSLALLASNLVRNAALHAATPVPAVNRAIARGVDRFHASIGVAPDDPRNTWPATRFELDRLPRDEDRSGNGLHAVLVTGSVAAALALAWRGRAGGQLARYAAMLPSAFVLFCLLLKWQPWHSRLHLPLFVVGAPLAGWLLERLGARFAVAIALLLAAGSVPYLVANGSRPLVGPRSVLAHTWTEQRTGFARALSTSYLDALEAMPPACRALGLAIGGNDPEYVIWTALRDTGRRVEISHVLVDNASRHARERRGAAPPCAIIAHTRLLGAPVRIGPVPYRRVWSGGATALLTPDPAPSPGPAP